MVEVRLSVTANADLAEIDAYGTEQFGIDAAGSYLQAFDKIFERLGRFPHSGEERLDYGQGIRCVFYRSHRILYLVEADRIVIARVLHHSRDVPRHLKP
ncbi:type II toxin-antitoxin system RelE/ParE family toxin [Novosphingobium colocasiae]|uniref:type II toxin-antitoxin system RelE/ParE family toxin n=1 Tax=Novosphingobium colocasiae TaxID=1256513 RepID=UPI0035B46953